MEKRPVFLWIVGALLAIALGAALDATVARAVRASGSEQFFNSRRVLEELLKAPGWYPITLVVAGLVAILHRARFSAALFFLLVTASAGLNEVIKWMVGRTRPFKADEIGERLAPFELQPLQFHYVKNLCFPSGHAALAFATAAALSMLWPRRRWLWYSVACVVAIERIAENAHWLSDIVAGAALGIGGVYVAAWLLRGRLKT